MSKYLGAQLGFIEIDRDFFETKAHTRFNIETLLSEAVDSFETNDDNGLSNARTPKQKKLVDQQKVFRCF